MCFDKIFRPFIWQTAHTFSNWFLHKWDQILWYQMIRSDALISNSGFPHLDCPIFPHYQMFRMTRVYCNVIFPWTQTNISVFCISLWLWLVYSGLIECLVFHWHHTRPRTPCTKTRLTTAVTFRLRTYSIDMPYTAWVVIVFVLGILQCEHLDLHLRNSHGRYNKAELTKHSSCSPKWAIISSISLVCNP